MPCQLKTENQNTNASIFAETDANNWSEAMTIVHTAIELKTDVENGGQTMAEIIETIAGLLWIALGVRFALMIRNCKERFDAILKELEDELNG